MILFDLFSILILLNNLGYSTTMETNRHDT